MTASRRQFLKAASALAAASGPMGSAFNAPLGLSLAGLGAMAAQSAQAADTTGYKALVCLFMAGGNDSQNWVVPMDASNYGQYAIHRRELALAQSRLLPITVTNQGSGRSFGMPQELAPLRNLYEAGQCAIVPNVGPLERPITKAEYLAGRAVPRKLFSHNDQQSTWQALAPEGARAGWGGRMGDLLMSANQYPVFTAVSTTGNAVFLSGNAVTQYQVGQDGLITVGGVTASSTFGSANMAGPMRQALLTAGTGTHQAEYVRVMQRSLDNAGALQSAMSVSSVPQLPNAAIALPSGGSVSLAQDALAKQLRVVSQLISAGQRLGMRRQVFMVQIGGFDSHNLLMRDQPVLMARVANSVQWFMSTMAGLGLQNNVTLFTASEFGRALVSNGDGCDHGWGGHQFVVGGAVRGRQMAGTFPVTALGTSTDIGSGRLLPSTSVTQLAANLGGWMGLTPAEQLMVLPNLGAFNQTALRLF